jgi:hypothetical protein
MDAYNQVKVNISWYIREKGYLLSQFKHITDYDDLEIVLKYDMKGINNFEFKIY